METAVPVVVGRVVDAVATVDVVVGRADKTVDSWEMPHSRKRRGWGFFFCEKGAAKSEQRFLAVLG